MPSPRTDLLQEQIKHMNKDIRRRYTGSCNTSNIKNEASQFDRSTFILRLLLFDTFILQSNNLTEFDDIITSFGSGETKEILNSGALKINSEAHAVAQTGQTGLGFRGKDKSGKQKKLLPTNSYSFNIVMHSDPKKIMHKNFKNIHKINGLHRKEAIKIKKIIANNLVYYPKESTSYILNQMISDFKNKTPNIRKAIITATKEKMGLNILPSEKITYSIEVDNNNDVHVLSNLSELFGIDENTAHKIIERALLAIGGLNKRIETMRSFSAITGFKESELSFFEDKLLFIQEAILPDAYEEKLKEILAWPIFPDLDQAIVEKRLKIDTLLKVRESSECIEFRTWLWDCDKLDIEELKERFKSLESKLLIKFSGKSSKAIRWLTATGAGFLPGIGLIAGPALSFLDSFLVEKLLPKSGVLTFLGHQYPTIYKGV